MSLHVLEVGEAGPRVVFLHGLFGQGRNFLQVAKALTPDLRSALVDLPDHGRSPWSDEVPYPAMADAVAETLRERYPGEPPMHVVGHSMGGKVAMLLALQHPELVDRLVVVDISPAESEGAGEFVHLLDSLAGLDLAALSRRSEADAALAGAIPDDRVRAFLLQNLRSSTEGFSWQANLSLLRRDLATIGGFPALEGRFDHPVLWIAGERSAYVQEEHAADMRRLFPRTTSVTIKGAGHWVHSEQPEAFVSALRVFLASDRRGRTEH
ncbi:alpha/beta fold hydrolase [Nocardioides sp.]|uniref:alpha/beta fold hydrolase n=1 Tax=Nocardioides sp. TaxID=35761 RepID=UPI003528D618